MSKKADLETEIIIAEDAGMGEPAKKEKKKKEKKEKKQRTKWKDLPAEVRKKKRKKYIIIGVAALVLVMFVVPGAFASGGSYPVTTVRVSRGDVEATITTSGKVESDVEKIYYTEITGNIGVVPIKQGQAVKSGDVLLHFSEETLNIANKDATAASMSSESTYSDAMNQASKTQAKYTEATVNLEVLEQQITDYKAFIKEQERKYEDTRNRKKADLSALGLELALKEVDGEDVAEEMAEYQYLLETVDMSKDLVEIQRTIDDAKEILGNLEEYEAEMKAQKSATEDNIMSSDTKEAKAMTNEAEQLKQAQTLNYASNVADGLKADMDGIVTELKVTEGAPVTAGAALVTVASNSQVHVTVNLSKSDLAKVEEGQKADVTIAGKKYEGTVSFINHMAVTNANNMPVVEAQIAITNADEEIYLGVEAKVVIYAQKSEDVLLVPVEAVNSDKNGDFVYVVENGIVVRKDVVTGVSSDTDIEIVSGLNENDQVMTEISLDITEGMEVTVMTDASGEEDVSETADSTGNDVADTDAENSTDTAEEASAVESE